MNNMDQSLKTELINKGFTEIPQPSVDIPVIVETFEMVLSDEKSLFYQECSSPYVEGISKEFYIHFNESNEKVYLLSDDIDFIIKCAEIVDIEVE